MRGGRLALTRLLEVGEDRRLVELGTQVEADGAERAGDEERDAPAPVLHGRLAEDDLQDEHDGRTEGEAAQRAELEEAAVQTATLVGRVLGHEGRGAAVLPAGGKALDEAQDDQERGRQRPMDSYVAASRCRKSPPTSG